jgi:putative ABC transport system permease protein
MVNLTFKDLFHSKGKFILIILGLSFSIFLVQYSAGMYNGVLEQSTKLMDEADYEVWLKAEDNKHFFESDFINDTSYYQLLNMGNIKEIERLIYVGADIQTEKHETYAIMIGFDIWKSNSRIEPWDVIKGDVDDLRELNTIIVDKSLEDSFPNLDVDDALLVGTTKMKVVGFCENSRFMGNSYIWTSIETARNAYPWVYNWSTAIAVNLDKNYEIDDFKDDVKDFVSKDLEVFSNEELKENTHSMIVNEGGLGGAIYILVGMGMFVGLIIISVTMYQSIQEKIPEFGTIKAIGAGKSFINKMLFGQVFVYITLGFLLGTLLAMLFYLTGLTGMMPIMFYFPTSLALYGVFLATGLMCSYITIRKVHRIDPAIVFRV